MGKSRTRKLRRRRVLLVLIGIALFLLITLTAMYLSGVLERQYYKLTYPEEIRRYAEDYGLDPCLVAAVIHVESGNRADAVSYKGAIGLMQIMPETGAWIAQKRAVAESHTESRLYTPDYNIACGCWYLDYLLKRFGGDLRYALIAYNAGPGNLETWLSDETLTEDGKLITIPYAETEAYVEKVMRAIEKYRELYAKELA